MVKQKDTEPPAPPPYWRVDILVNDNWVMWSNRNSAARKVSINSNGDLLLFGYYDVNAEGYSRIVGAYAAGVWKQFAEVNIEESDKLIESATKLRR